MKDQWVLRKQYKNCIYAVSDSSLQLTFKKLTRVEFLCSIKEYPQLPEKAIKILSPSTYGNRLNADIDMKMQLSSIKPEVKKEICNNIEQCHFSI